MIRIERQANRLLRKFHRIAEITGFRSMPRRAIFMHIPKCAGSSVASAAKSYLGSEKSGKVVVLDDSLPDRELHERIARAKDAMFVTGHFGFETLELVRQDAYVFTMLRDPYDRLRSAYGYLTSLQKRNPIPQTLRHLSVETFLASKDPAILQWSDNVIARTFAQTCERSRVTFASVDAMTSTAIHNLAVFDHIGFFDTLDQDILSVAAATRIPTFVKLHHRNSTQSHLRNDARPDATAPLTDKLRAKIAHLVHGDLRVYKAALRLSGRILAPAPAGPPMVARAVPDRAGRVAAL